MKNKRLLLVPAILLMLLTIILPARAENTEKASIKFEETVYDFGHIKEDGGSVTHEFHFTNTGKSNLVIQSAKAECGCTSPRYSEEPVAPGKSGVIKVTFNPMGRPGGFTKVITVKTNGNPSKVNLKIRGTVTPKNK